MDRTLASFAATATAAALSGCIDAERVSLLEATDAVAIELSGDTRKALAPSFPAMLDFDVQLTANPMLDFAIGVATDRPVPRGRVDFRVRVVSEDFPVTIFQKSLRVDEHNQWHEMRRNLSAWAGKSVTIRFETFPTRARESTPWSERVQTLWAEPTITTGGSTATTETPSVIVIVVDTLRHDYLGIHGFDGDISGNLDWLALESVRFDKTFAPAPWTKPSVATLLTGLHPDTHQVREQPGRTATGATETLPQQAVTIAEAYRDSGYATAAFVGNPWLAPPYGFDQGFDAYVVDNHDDRLIEDVRDWIASRPEGEPYFLYLHLFNVHGPYRAPEQDYLALSDSPTLGPERSLGPGSPTRPSYLEATPWARAEENQRLRPWKAKYGAGIRLLDRRLGALLDELRHSGELDQTRVVFTSDHGEELVEHDQWGHGYSLCDHQLRVPLWIREPGAKFAGRRVNEVASLLDVMPTLLGASSIPIPEPVQGENRSRWLTDQPPEPRERSVALAASMLHDPGVRSLRTARYRLVWDDTSGEIHLFDTKVDPAEQTNVAESESALASRLETLLLAEVKEIAAAGALESKVAPLPDELRERLRALGYVQ